ncbi:MAG: LysM peptidoglycan-binding domain-containing protein, partial [Anaerolineales bacterium]
PEATPSPTSALPASPIPVTATATLLPTSTQDPSAATVTFTVTNTLSASVACPQPAGWIAYTIQAGDTLESLSSKYRTDVNTLRSNNCLLIDSLIPGTLFYVPPAPTSTVAVCSQGAVGWVKSYIVIRGDTMYSIAANHYTTVGLLQKVNCKNTEFIVAGEILWVPNVATRTPYPTPMPGVTASPYPTDPLTQTALPFTATIFPTNTPIPNTLTASSTPTFISTPTPSLTPFGTP